MKRGFLTPVLMAALVFAALLGPSIVQAQQWAPDIVLSDLQGKTFKLRDYRNKTVLLVFGATWCPACRTEIPHFKQIYATYVPRGLEMAYVNIQENRDKVAKFAEKYALPYRILLDTRGDVADAYGNRGVPALVLVQEGKILLHTGVDPRNYSRIDIFLERLFKK